MLVSHYLKLVHNKKYCVKDHYRSYNLLPWRCSYSLRIYMLGVRRADSTIVLEKAFSWTNQNCHSQKRKKNTQHWDSRVALPWVN